jgi:hypothetical protein
MKPESKDRGDDDRLHKLLQSWKVSAPLPPGFQDSVWTRITREETKQQASPAVRLWEELLARWRAFLVQPAGASAYLLALLVVGVGLGYLQSEHYTEKAEKAWRTAYVQSVNPAVTSLQQ